LECWGIAGDDARKLGAIGHAELAVGAVEVRLGRLGAEEEL
jgi:hypothetical protein